MSSVKTYIQVIVPLRLGWEPYYSLDGEDAVRVGDFVAVPFARRRQIGVVSAVDVSLPPGMSPGSVKSIYRVHSERVSIGVPVLDFWRRLADYYMCTTGEVLKMACPLVRSILCDGRKGRPREFVPVASDFAADEGSVQLSEKLSGLFWPGSSRIGGAVRETCAGSPGKVGSGPGVVLLESDPSLMALALLCRRVMGLDEASSLCRAQEGTGGEPGGGGRSVLWIVPSKEALKALEKPLKKLFGSKLIVCPPVMTASRRMEVEKALASGATCMILGVKNAIFLPYSSLGLVIVQDEHDRSYKQGALCPRYNARDAAVMLASVFGAKVLLQSQTPSFESLHNAATGKFGSLRLSHPSLGDCDVDVIDITSEQRKKGLDGDIPKRLLPGWDASSEPSRMCFMKMGKARFPETESLRSQIFSAFGADAFFTDDIYSVSLPADTTRLCIFGIDSILSRNDFRSDETALHELETAVSQCKGKLSEVHILTRGPRRTLFVRGFDVKALLSERREFGFPPYTRLVDLQVRQSSPEKNSSLVDALLKALVRDKPSDASWQVYPIADGLRIVLAKDRRLLENKRRLRCIVDSVEDSTGTPGAVSFDVDP